MKWVGPIGAESDAKFVAHAQAAPESADSYRDRFFYSTVEDGA